MVIRAVVYGLLGWVAEVLWTGLGSLIAGDPRLTGYTYLWMFLIYGLAVFLEPIHDYVRENHWFLRGLVYASAIFIIEYSSGWILRQYLGVCPWNYEAPLAVNGLIRLDYAPVWFTAGLIFERVHDYLDNLVEIG